MTDTERRLAEELAALRREHHALLDATSDAIISTGLDFVIQGWNRAAEAMYGWTAADAIGRVMEEIVPTEYLGTDPIEAHTRFLEDDHWSGKLAQTRKDGSRITVMSTVNAVCDESGTAVGAVAVNRDISEITDRRATEDALRESEKFLAAVYNNSDIGVFVVRVEEDGSYVFEGINPAHEKLLGMANSDIAGKTPDELIPALGRESVEYIKAYYDEAVRRRETLESEYEVPEGPAKGWWLSRMTPHIDESGRVTRLMGSGLVITELKEAQAALRESEMRLQTMFDCTPDYVMLLDAEQRILMVNRVVEGLDAGQLLGTAPHLLVPPDDQERVQRHLQLVVETGAVQQYQVVYRGPDSEHQFATVAAPVVVLGEIVGIVVSARDITDRIRLENEKLELEEQYRQSQKMEAIGQLAGGIAHDFNNLLTVINSYSSLVFEELRRGDPMRADIQQILDAGARAASLTGQLLAFSRKQVMELRNIDLNAVVSDLESMLRRLIGEDVQLHTSLRDGLGLVRADPHQIELVIMNLVVNARDSMPSGGNLHIETREGLGGLVLLEVRDSGVGMSSDVLERVFEPFFTTKEPDRGTGLGLATVYGVVKQTGGDITVESEVGVGTTFLISLPRPTGEASSRIKVDERDRGGKETILLVEDERAVLQLTRRILTSAGYGVIAASNGGEALLACEQYEGIDLVLTDVVMPRMSGRALVERLSEVRPGLTVLYMSGYSDNAIAHHGVLERNTNFIAKPFSVQDLLRKVRQALDESYRV